MATTISLRSARFDSRYGTASSFGCQIVTIPKARKPALAPLSKVCRKRSELPPRCYNFITILGCLRNGRRKTVRSRQMASRSAVRQCRYDNDSIEQRFHTLPGVKNVGLCTYTPMEDNNWSTGIMVQGQPDPHNSASFVRAN